MAQLRLSIPNLQRLENMVSMLIQYWKLKDRLGILEEPEHLDLEWSKEVLSKLADQCFWVDKDGNR